jgi:fused signal recognition particle receptor
MFKIFSKSKKTADAAKSFGLGNALKQFFTHKKLDVNFIDELEELLIISDIGIEATSQIIENFKQQKFVKDIDLETVKKFLAKEIENILQPFEAKLELNENHLPQVLILFQQD